MPIYEYECTQCGAEFDCVVMNISDPFHPTCEKCQSTDVKKLVSRVRYLGGPKEDGLAENAEKRMLQSLGGKVSDKTRQEIRDLSQTAAKRGKRRFESSMDTGKTDAVDY
ncbi:MAG: zinc ribbon domain-containing protein [bacterium]|nr:zinc ribbon domain-containing protein [bacterium]